ncbi:alpha/beta fold hydrolase [uncultured Tessaracoccus sp.]|uniref:alpha/beta fold hydrolase n=1 Tax=uncultured Tessaracoccus sp. TaxID=905023 RepID=UPI0025F64E02|nr:alpha/beta hydrolase [uncultured Tessaracoccus sp.]
MTTRMVLVPGYWLGAWAWDDVLPHLPEGIDAVPVTLPGQAPEREPDVTLAQQAAAIEAALDVPADWRVLVVHSGSTNPGTMLLDRRPDLVDRMVFVDTAPPKPGLANNPDATGDATLEQMLADTQEAGAFAGLTEEQLATFEERAVPQPRSVVIEPVDLHDDARHRVPVTVVCCSYTSAEFQEFADRGIPFIAALNDYDDVTYVDLRTGHWPMWSRPQDLADVLAELA